MDVCIILFVIGVFTPAAALLLLIYLIFFLFAFLCFKRNIKQQITYDFESSPEKFYRNFYCNSKRESPRVTSFFPSRLYSVCLLKHEIVPQLWGPHKSVHTTKKNYVYTYRIPRLRLRFICSFFCVCVVIFCAFT